MSQTSYSTMHWSSVSSPYSSGEYSPTTYQSSIHPASQSMVPVYDDLHSPTSEGDYSPSYYSSNASYTHSSSSPSGQTVYSPTGQSSNDDPLAHGLRQSHHSNIQRPQSTHPYSAAWSHTRSHSYGHSHYSSHGQARTRTHSQAHTYSSQHPTSPSYQNNTSQYPAQIPLTPQVTTSPSQYPASPSRPFSCDLCALSFNRQHDLKRHRETHTGEKPYFCNGGCGKTFTRKDALKRHQLVKGCGKPDEPWSAS